MKTSILIATVCAFALLAADRVGPASAYPPADVPGVINPDVTQENISKTVCVPNWTKTVRPPVSYTDGLKKQLMVRLKLTGQLNDYELDHRLDLAAGGAPRDPQNLWMEKWPEARLKDRLESFEHRRLCKGEITLKEAQAVFLGDFWSEYDRLAQAQGWPKR